MWIGKTGQRCAPSVLVSANLSSIWRSAAHLRLNPVPSSVSAARPLPRIRAPPTTRPCLFGEVAHLSQTAIRLFSIFPYQYQLDLVSSDTGVIPARPAIPLAAAAGPCRCRANQEHPLKRQLAIPRPVVSQVAGLRTWQPAPTGMVRKAAPQPLSLGDTVRPSDDSRSPETVPRSARLPPDATSPRSPRSPFRYGQTNADIIGVGEPQPLADVLHQPRQSLEYPKEPRPRQQHPDDARDPPQPSRRDHSADQQQPLSHRHTRREDKASKSGFFFNFGKGHKSSDRPILHQHSNSRAEAMSRDGDRPALSKQTSKHSGTQTSGILSYPHLVTLYDSLEFPALSIPR